jgi:hypothetical protein
LTALRDEAEAELRSGGHNLPELTDEELDRAP